MYIVIKESSKGIEKIGEVNTSNNAYNVAENEVYKILQNGNIDTIEPIIRPGKFDLANIKDSGTYAYSYHDKFGNIKYMVYRCIFVRHAGVIWNSKTPQVEVIAKIYIAKNNEDPFYYKLGSDNLVEIDEDAANDLAFLLSEKEAHFNRVEEEE